LKFNIKWGDDIFTKNKMIFIIILSFIIVVIIASIIFVLYQKHLSDTKDIVFTVDSYPVSKQEFEMVLEDNKAMIYSDFRPKSSISNANDFWHTAIDGEIPVEVLFNTAVNECIRYKTEQILAKKYKIIEDISYNGFLKSFKAENQDRRDKLSKNQPIYGPQQYGVNEYFNYYIIEIRNKTQSQMQILEPNVGMEEYKKLYEQIKDKNFKKSDSYKLIDIRFSKPDGYAKAQQVYTDLKSQINKGLSVESKLKEINVKYELLDLNENTMRSYSLNNSFVLEKAVKLNQNSLSEILESETRYDILYCLERKSGEYLDFDTVLDVVKSRYYQSIYDEMLSNYINKQKIQKNELFFELIKNYGIS